MRLNYREVSPDALKAMLGLEAVANRGLDNPRLLDLVKVRASQINGCAYCLALHAAEAREHGETDERLDMVAVWREADCFGRAERAALAWCEALTRLPDTGAPDALFEELPPHFTGADRRADARDCGDQRLESPQCRIPHPGGRREGTGHA
jgi:AhpD family alkylhydroperoxidase